MAITIPVQVGDVAFHVRQLTVREIYALFEQARDGGGQAKQNGEPPDWVGNVLFDDATISDILTFTDLTRERLLDLMPVQVEEIIAEIKRGNPHFFAACRKLEEVGRRLDQVLTKRHSSDSETPSSP